VRLRPFQAALEDHFLIAWNKTRFAMDVGLLLRSRQLVCLQELTMVRGWIETQFSLGRSKGFDELGLSDTERMSILIVR
jgi:hypothetical protein